MQGDATYAMPFEPYDVQAEMMQTITTCLDSSSPPIPVAAVELPTGCGKTLALLSSVLRYQAMLEQLTPHELEERLCKRRWRPCAAPLLFTGSHHARAREEAMEKTTFWKKEKMNREGADDEEQWRMPSLFFKQFGARTKKRSRVELSGTSSDLRRQHRSPPCTIFYVTRTHAQLRQAVGELRRLRGLQRLKMNILGSRERYCINKVVRMAQAKKTLPVEMNNLGEVCDKLVSLGQCEAIHNYTSLASKAISRVLCRGGTEKVWDMEDLVAEGVASEGCPYYAARDLVFFAHINFATYQYLLDPIIRHECKLEAALRNNSIIVFDEAHNVPLVCQDALSLETPIDALHLLVSELSFLVIPSETISTLSYPREFKLTHWTLVELFTLLYDLFSAVVAFVKKPENCTAQRSHHVPKGRVRKDHYNKRKDDGNDDGDDDDGDGRGPTLGAETLVNVIHRSILDRCSHAFRDGGQSSNNTSDLSVFQIEGMAMFRQVYGLVMSLGVTFNPFDFSVFGLSIMKRWLLVMRFMLQKPNAFVLSVSDDHSKRDNALGKREVVQRTVNIRCLDGSLSFYHLLSATHRVVLASGTLAPFDELGRELGVPLTNMMIYEGSHVVEAHQYRLAVLTQLLGASRLHCNYKNLMDASFIKHLVTIILILVDQVPVGGALIFFPNYRVMEIVGSRVLAHYCGGVMDSRRVPEVFLETKSAAEFPAMLDAFREATSRGTAILASVYRGKVSEGINFADSMARLVLCVGVPFQPLRSWSVMAQRSYSGEDWYVADALRAMNQAIGRCLRNRQDYGAIVLLDDRFEQETTKRLLPRWCRERLTVHQSPTSLVNELHSFYQYHITRFSSGTGGLQKSLQEKMHQGSSGELSERPASDQIDHIGLSISSASRKRHSKAVTLFPLSSDSVKEYRITTCTHEWSCTAVKLIYEACNSVDEVSPADLRETLHLLEDEYMGL